MQKDSTIHQTDQELLEKFYATADNQWLGILLDRYTLLLFGLCMKYLKQEEEARDMVQQVFLKVLTELPKYKVDYFKSWLYMVAKNHCLMKLRSSQGKSAVELKDQLLPMEELSLNKDFHIEKETLLTLMETSLQELNPAQQQCLKLFYLEKKTYQEIVGATNFSMMQVKSHIQNGKRNLKLLIEKKRSNHFPA